MNLKDRWKHFFLKSFNQRVLLRRRSAVVFSSIPRLFRIVFSPVYPQCYRRHQRHPLPRLPCTIFLASITHPIFISGRKKPFQWRGGGAHKSQSMAKWEKNVKWSKIDFLILVFFFFYWINMSMKDNEWPLKCFRGKKISLHCPLNVDMSEYWGKNDFLPEFFKVILDWFNICVQKRSLWDMLG